MPDGARISVEGTAHRGCTIATHAEANRVPTVPSAPMTPQWMLEDTDTGDPRPAPVGVKSLSTPRGAYQAALTGRALRSTRACPEPSSPSTGTAGIDAVARSRNTAGASRVKYDSRTR
jgi:hypothetical protein